MSRAYSGASVILRRAELAPALHQGLEEAATLRARNGQGSKLQVLTSVTNPA